MKLYHHARYISWGATNLFGPEKWFNVRPGVQLKWVPTIAEANIPDADVVVATGWPPGGVYGRVFGVDGAKYYLLQHYETWWGPAGCLRDSSLGFDIYCFDPAAAFNCGIRMNRSPKPGSCPSEYTQDQCRKSDAHNRRCSSPEDARYAET